MVGYLDWLHFEFSAHWLLFVGKLMTKTERLILTIGDLLALFGAVMLGKILSEAWDWRLIIAYISGGIGAVIIGASQGK